MNFRMIHQNFNVLDLDRSIVFYREALGLHEKCRHTAPDGSFILAYLGSGESDFELELTRLRGREKPYDLGEGEFHLAFRTDSFEEAYALHKKMGCICFENPAVGVYFIQDPDGYWLEILPERKH